MDKQKWLNKKILEETYSSDITDAQALLELGADPNAKNEYGATVLMEAAGADNLQLCKLLIENGADVNIKNKYKETALFKALRKDEKILRLLIENGADVNAQDNYGNTALMKVDDLEKAKLLIENGADVNAQDNYGRTALMEAANLEKAKLLVENGADFNITNKWDEDVIEATKDKEVKAYLKSVQVERKVEEERRAAEAEAKAKAAAEARAKKAAERKAKKAAEAQSQTKSKQSTTKAKTEAKQETTEKKAENQPNTQKKNTAKAKNNSNIISREDLVQKILNVNNDSIDETKEISYPERIAFATAEIEATTSYLKEKGSMKSFLDDSVDLYYDILLLGSASRVLDGTGLTLRNFKTYAEPAKELMDNMGEFFARSGLDFNSENADKFLAVLLRRVNSEFNKFPEKYDKKGNKTAENFNNELIAIRAETIFNGKEPERYI